jgi:hypothetical protein
VLGSAYRGRVRSRESDVRECVILGHRLEVFLSEAGHWCVAVDGEENPACFASSYSAWAVGAAESYRQGRTARAPSVLD